MAVKNASSTIITTANPYALGNVCRVSFLNSLLLLNYNKIITKLIYYLDFIDTHFQ